MQLVKGASQNNFYKNVLEWNLIIKKFQETTPTLLEQDTKIQTLIRMTNCSKDTQKFHKVQIR